jgi:hypothetical protein
LACTFCPFLGDDAVGLDRVGLRLVEVGFHRDGALQVVVLDDAGAAARLLARQGAERGAAAAGQGHRVGEDRGDVGRALALGPHPHLDLLALVARQGDDLAIHVQAHDARHLGRGEAGVAHRLAVERQHHLGPARHLVVGDVLGARNGAHDAQQIVGRGAQALPGRRRAPARAPPSTAAGRRRGS